MRRPARWSLILRPLAAVVLVAVLLAACGSTVTPATGTSGPSPTTYAAISPTASSPAASSPTPADLAIWGPLAVIPPPDGADTARAEGRIHITSSCVTLESQGESTLLVWPADRTTWDPAAGTITFANIDGTSTTVRDGDAVILGGGGDSSAESGISGEAWVGRMTWVAPPAASCPIETRWGVGDVRLAVSADASQALPLPPPDTGKLGRPWYFGGEIVPPYVLSLEPGPGHCGWDDMLFLGMNRELGQPKGSEATDVMYVRDPRNRWAPGSPDAAPNVTLGRFEPSVTPPDDVAFTGYTYVDGMELWRSASATDALVFLRRGDIWEQWPRLRLLAGCM